MNKTKYKQSPLSTLKGHLLSIILFATILGMFLWGLGDAELNSRAEGKRVLEESVRRAVVSCYALEGSYPQDLEYIEDNYGIKIDESKYSVKYSIFASNIMPEITVLEVGHEEVPK
ncbi:MAG: hypothetical protein RR911_02375 [Oscillospiraceae bacterium]